MKCMRAVYCIKRALVNVFQSVCISTAIVFAQLLRYLYQCYQCHLRFKTYFQRKFLTDIKSATYLYADKQITNVF